MDDEEELSLEVKRWAAMSCTAIEIKIGESWGAAAERDLARMRTVRTVAGDGASLMADVNGA
jgi:L-alanine-DL-glutamate epimerase-like enolase superfamily enzyme